MNPGRFTGARERLTLRPARCGLRPRPRRRDSSRRQARRLPHWMRCAMSPARSSPVLNRPRFCRLATWASAAWNGKRRPEIRLRSISAAPIRTPRKAAVDGLQGGGAPEQVAAVVRNRLDQIDQETQATTDAAMNVAHKAATGLATGLQDRAEAMGIGAQNNFAAASGKAQGAVMGIGQPIARKKPERLSGTL